MASSGDRRKDLLMVKTGAARRDAGPTRMPPNPALTVLYHPDLARVGERVVLRPLLLGRQVALCRLEPLFAQPGARAAPEPLADSCLSRRPVWLQPGAQEGDVTVAREADGMAVTADGEPVGASRAFTEADLDRGVVLELAGRVVLLLHRLEPAGERPEPLGLVGESDAINRVRAAVRKVADLSVPVLLRGETGTGKELVAQAIHGASPRAERAWVAVNMAAVPPTTAASELFGHARGAFTGAGRDRPGCFQQAHDGTLFLDEVGETPLDVQAMLLRALETGEVQPVGAPQGLRVDVRLITATDADLDDPARFRSALLHRLAGYEIVLPPLRARRDDVGRLFFHFLRQALAETGDAHRLAPAAPEEQPWLPASVVARLARFDWPGNVRQLRNVARQLAISNRGEREVQIDAALERVLAPARVASGGAPAAARRARKPSEVTEEELVQALREERFRLGPTAARLGIPRSSLYSLIERSTTLRKARDVSQEELERALAECGGDLDELAAKLEVSSRGLQFRMKELGLG